MHPERRPSPSPESLEARLRALPQPPVPAGLEAPIRPPDGAAWWLARRDLDEAETPAFAWPLEEAPPVTVATALSPDLLE